MPLLIVSIAVQILLIVHVLRTGRDPRWIFLMILLPPIGALAYLIVEILPSLRHNPRFGRILAGVRRAVNADRNLRRDQLEFEANQSVESAVRLARELTRRGRSAEAIQVCNEVRQGIFKDDPKILVALSEAQFAHHDFADTVATLDHLRKQHPEFRSPDAHLLYARALEEQDETDKALEEYEALSRYYPGAEARVRLALLNKKLGRTEAARQMFESILQDARLAPSHFRKSQREWIAIAERESK
jgi:hypothetical protein